MNTMMVALATAKNVHKSEIEISTSSNQEQQVIEETVRENSSSSSSLQSSSVAKSPQVSQSEREKVEKNDLKLNFIGIGNIYSS